MHLEASHSRQLLACLLQYSDTGASINRTLVDTSVTVSTRGECSEEVMPSFCVHSVPDPKKGPSPSLVHGS